MARKILLADDSVTAQNMGRKILADAGYEVITVNNGSAALKKIAELKPDLIVLDVYMPGYSGLEVCHRLKEAQETSRIPVLLTVGKLEPFKPEEAKRVRAEGFIVKPFEASELLSAITKLEDKIVPRSESSKPGRFARAVAAVEESNREAGGEEDSSWKSRISFPTKKKKKKEDEDQDRVADEATYNAVNKDLRTVVGQKGQQDAAAAVPPGLPKDVTPEEIAALAAAAAQVQGAGAVSNSVADSRAGTAEGPTAAKVEDAKIESKSEPPTAVEEQVPATFAEHKIDEHAPEAKIATAADAALQSEKTQNETEDRASSSHADVIAAIAALEPANGHSWDANHSGNGHSGAEKSNEVPAALVAAAAAGSSSGPRWTAVPTAIDASESAISLELEMQKAYAAFAAAEANSPAFVSSSSASPSFESSPAAQASVETLPAVATPELEQAQAPTVVASTAAEAVSAPVAEFVPVAPTYIEPEQFVPAEAEPAATAQVAESAPQSEPAAPIAEATPAIQEQIAEPARAEEPIAATPETISAASTDVPQVVSEPTPVVAETSSTESHSHGTTRGDESAHKESDLAASTAAAWASWRQIRESGDPRGTEPSRAKREQEDDPQSAPSADAAAMAVAAGAEKSPADTPEGESSDPNEIASIVDSVLADLRPKIFAEISKKMGGKK